MICNSSKTYHQGNQRILIWEESKGKRQTSIQNHFSLDDIWRAAKDEPPVDIFVHLDVLDHVISAQLARAIITGERHVGRISDRQEGTLK